MIEILRKKQLAPVWTILRIWLGYQWLIAGWEKIASGKFDASGFMKGAIAQATGEHPAVQGWYASFLKNVALPHVSVFNLIVPWGELLVGIGLIIGALTTIALLAGIFMNLNYMLAGTTSTNPILYTVAAVLLAAGASAYVFGADYFLQPITMKVLRRTAV